MYGRVSDPGMGTSGLARGATPAARWLHDPQPFGNHEVGSGFPHRAGPYRPRGLHFRPRFVGVVDMEGVLIQGWDIILPRCSATSLSRGATLDSRWLHEPQPISDYAVGLGLYTVRSGIDPGDLRFRPRYVGVMEIWKDFLSGDGNVSSPGAARPRGWPEGQLPPHAGSMSTSRSAITQWGRGCLTAPGGIDRGDPFSSPVCWSCRDMEGFLMLGWHLILHGRSGTPTLSRGETLAAGWHHEPEPVRNQPVGLGIPHRTGQYRPGNLRFRPRFV